jgi:hypothetical protein
MSEKATQERWQDRWARLGEVYAEFEKHERESGKFWRDIPNPTEYVLDRMETAEAKVAELERKIESLGGICPHCGGRADLPAHHIERCYCLPAVKSYQGQVVALAATIERLENALQYSPISVACPSCGSPVLAPCVAFSQHNPAPPPMKGFHPERRAALNLKEPA